MKELIEYAKQAGFWWHADKTEKQIKEKIKQQLEWYNLEPGYIEQETNERTKRLYTIGLVYSGLKGFSVMEPEKVIENFKLDDKGIIDLPSYLRGQKLRVVELDERVNGVGIDGFVHVKKQRRTEENLQRLKEQYMPEYQLTATFNKEKADMELGGYINSQIEKELTEIKKNKELYKWLSEFASTIMKTYYNDYKKTMEAETE